MVISIQTQQTNLSNWITEIHIGMINVLLEDSGIFINYAAGGYGSLSCPRAITLQISRISYDAILTTAEEARDALYATNGTIHSDVNGWLIPVVNPREFVHAGGHSDEAQSFVSQLDNYWKVWAPTGGNPSVSGGLTCTVDGSDNSAGGGAGRRQSSLVAVTPKVAATPGTGVMLSA
ncbi:hypothetical protein FRB95_012269 [Tulasnella sp. JGI-2019a]|nr:hypothetical protein FRB95_012269 [Tulasnella sp. JGI-2019a]